MSDEREQNVVINYTTEEEYQRIKQIAISKDDDDYYKQRFEETLFIVNNPTSPLYTVNTANMYLGSQALADIVFLNKFTEITVTENTTTHRLKVTNTDTSELNTTIGNRNKLYVWFNVDKFNIYYFDKNEIEYQYIPVTKEGGTSQAGYLNYVSYEADINNEDAYYSQTWIYYPQSEELPTYDTTIHYIQNSGTQFIDTNIYFQPYLQKLEVECEWTELPTESYIALFDHLALYNAGRYHKYDIIGNCKQGGASILDYSVEPPQVVFAATQCSSISVLKMYDETNEINQYFMSNNGGYFWWNDGGMQRQILRVTDGYYNGESFGTKIVATGDSYYEPNYVTVNWNALSPLRIFGFKGYTGIANVDYEGTETMYVDIPDYVYSYSNVRIYNVKITEISTNTVLHNLIPAIRTSDNEIGLYDEVTDTFYANNGTGTFITG